MRVGGHRLAGGPKEKWSDCVMEGMNLLEVDEHVVQDQWIWRAVITCKQE